MSIELDRDKERLLIRTALRRELALVRAAKADTADSLANMITEALFETAAMTVQRGPEEGIRAGREMIRKWSD